MTRRFPRLGDRLQGLNLQGLRSRQNQNNNQRIRFRFNLPNFEGIEAIPQENNERDQFNFPNLEIPDVQFVPPPSPNFPDRNIPNVAPIPGITTENARTTDRIRKITISQNRLDPLASWCFSRAKYGNRSGVKFLAPLDNSPNLRATNPDLRFAPSAEWSLAPIGDQLDPPRQTNISTLSSFMRAVNPSPLLLQEHYRTLFAQGNPYVFVEKPFQGSRETYRSFAAEMLDSMLATSERILDSLSLFSIDGSQTNFQRELDEVKVRYVRQLNPPAVFAEEDPEINFFFNKLDIIGQDVIFGEGNLAQEAFDLRRSIKDRVTQTNSDISFLTIVTELLVTVAADQISRDREKRIIRHVIADLLHPIFPITTVEAMQDMNTYQYRYDYVEFDTPYVTNRNTHTYLENIQESNYTSKAISDYKYFAKDYEELIADVQETLLPNAYAIDEYINLSALETRSPAQDIKLTEFGTYLSLGERLSDYDDVGRYTRERYYNTYAKVLGGIPDSEALIWDSKNSSIIIESDNIKENQLFHNQPPMSIGIEFVRSDSRHFQALINSPDMGLEDPDFRETMFQNIDNLPSTEGRTEMLYATEYLANGPSGLLEKQSGFMPMALRRIPFPDLVAPQFLGNTDSVLNSSTEFKSLVIGDVDDVTSEDELGVLEELVHNEAEIVSRNSYAAIINAQSSPSDALGYKISKNRNNQNLQNFYLGNGPGPRRVIYTDSQIRYDEEYSYELYEYRLIFGTKYSFDTIGTVPVWLLQYYLGLSRGPTQRQLSEAPNVSFKCYAKTFADYGVTEVPIYRDDLEPVGGVNSLLSSDLTNETVNSITYSLSKVMDYPPMQPVLNVFPLLGNNSQVKMNMSPQLGESLGNQAQEIVSIGDRSEQIDRLKTYQDNFKNMFVPSNKLEYRSEGLAEVKCITLYRTTSIDLDVENYNDIYRSFDSQNNPDVFVRTFSNRSDVEIDGDITEVLSYDIRENIQPNINYYYTAIVEDIHNNPSNPSIIYRVRLLLDKGLLIPEVALVMPRGSNKKTPTKDLTRFLQIEASNIQTFPITSTDVSDVSFSRSLGASLGRSVEDQSYIVRLTSKDTGRSFDIKLNFVVRIDGSPINVGT